MFEKKQPKPLWPKAVNTTKYLLNLSVTRALTGKTPFEAWFDLKPSVKHLKVFGCVCFAKIFYAKRTNLSSKSLLAIHLGYNEVSKGYRLLDVKTMKLFIGRDVVFDEDKMWNWEFKLVERLNNHVIEGNQLPQEEFELNTNDVDEILVRGTRSLTDIYARCHLVITEPGSYEEATTNEHWKQAMEAKMVMIRKNRTQLLVDKLEDQNGIGVKWIFRTKLNPDDSINKYKARLVIKGFAQVYGVDYMETYALVARHDTIRLLATLSI